MKKLLVFVLVFIGISGLLYGIYKSPLFRVQVIEFNSEYGMDEDTVYIHTALSRGKLYFSVDPARVRDGLLHHPFVRDVEVTKTFPNKVTLRILYRRHFVTLSYLDALLSLDDEMVVLGVMSKYDKGYRISGLPFQSYSAGRVVEIVKLYVLKNIISYIKLFELARIEPEKEIRFEENCILFVVDGIEVNFGLGENYEKRFNDFVVIYNDLQSKGVKTGTIHIGSDGSPVYQPFGD